MITLLMPTVGGRERHLHRTLAFLAAQGLTGRLIISDHSPPGREIDEGSVARAAGRPVQVTRHDPSLHFLERLVDLARMVDTPYVMVHADDDFAYAEGLAACAGALDGDPSAVVVQGRMAHLRRKDDGGFVCRSYPRAARHEPEAADRLLALLRSFCSVLYAVHRTGSFIEIARNAVERTPDVAFWQYALSTGAALRGRCLTIDRLAYVRESHDDSWGNNLVLTRDKTHFPWLVLAPHFSDWLQRFKAAVLRDARAHGAEVTEEDIDPALIGLLGHAVHGLRGAVFEPGEESFQRALSDPLSRESRLVALAARALGTARAAA